MRIWQGLVVLGLCWLLGLVDPLEAGEKLDPRLAPLFTPPADLANDFGAYRSPLQFNDDSEVKNATDWARRRKEILTTWHELMGPWPALIEKPKIEYLAEERRDNFKQHHVRIEIAPDRMTNDAYLLVPDGEGPFPAVLVVYYDAKTGIGLGKELRDFGYQLAKRGFVVLSLGGPEGRPAAVKDQPILQPLSYNAYVAANCHTLLANLAKVDPERIGVVGHSYGGKWAMFASCLHESFACGVWSDGGIVFDEKRSNVNYWEPWYLGLEEGQARKPGIPTDDNPRTGAYKRMMETGRDLHELHALMAPRPFLVSGGSEDHVQRWKALNHTIAVNRLLGHDNRVAMSNRQGHAPTPESNEQIYQFFEHALRKKSD